VASVSVSVALAAAITTAITAAAVSIAVAVAIMLAAASILGRVAISGGLAGLLLGGGSRVKERLHVQA
jgi:hypothetical protein